LALRGRFLLAAICSRSYGGAEQRDKLTAPHTVEELCANNSHEINSLQIHSFLQCAGNGSVILILVLVKDITVAVCGETNAGHLLSQTRCASYSLT
jgi:hypothetical protein